MDDRKRHHSFFWPTLLIGVGVVWLLVNFNVIQPISINAIWQFWPLLLVILGLDILFGRRNSWAGGVVGLLAIVFVVAFLVSVPKYGVNTTTTPSVDEYSEPVDSAVLADYNIVTSSEPVELYSLSNSDNLIEASIAHQGQITFDVSGTNRKSVLLREETNSSSWLTWNPSTLEEKWKIGLNPEIDTVINLDGGSGSINADLTGMKLETLSADLASGSSNFTLPVSSGHEEILFDCASGSLNVDLPKDTALTLRLYGSSGSVNINLPEGAEVRIEVRDNASGSLNFPDSLTRVSGGVDTGTWESSGYASTASPILIQILDRGSGSISIE